MCLFFYWRFRYREYLFLPVLTEIDIREPSPAVQEVERILCIPMARISQKPFPYR